MLERLEMKNDITSNVNELIVYNQKIKKEKKDHRFMISLRI